MSEGGSILVSILLIGGYGLVFRLFYSLSHNKRVSILLIGGYGLVFSYRDGILITENGFNPTYWWIRFSIKN